MELRLNINGAERKALVMAVSEISRRPPRYLGAPSFAYMVGDYHIDREGTLTGDCTPEFMRELRQKGYAPPCEEPPAPDVTEPTEQDEPDTLTIEIPKDGFTETAVENLEKIIAGKAALIKKAVGTETLAVEQTDETLKFPWFTAETAPDKLNAYAKLITALCRTAKTQSRVVGREKEVVNEKYAFRCFLLRLGFIGDEYKDARKILLENLSGSASYKNREVRRRRADMYGGNRETTAEQEETNGV